MLVDGVHHRLEDWSVFFLNRPEKDLILYGWVYCVNNNDG